MEPIFNTNKERAERLGLKPAPTIKGYYFDKDVIAETIRNNISFTKGKAEKPALLGIFIESAPFCNLRCPHCYTDAFKSNEKLSLNSYKFEIWKRNVEIAKEFGIKSVVFAGRGEPLLDPTVVEMLKYITDIGLWAVVFTNNTQIDIKIAEMLYNLNVSIIAKLGSLNPEKQDKLVGKKGAHISIYKGLANLLQVGFNKEEGRLGIDATVIRSNLDELLDIFIFCRINGIIPYFEFLIEEGRARKWKDFADENLTNAEKIEFFEKLRDIDEKVFGYSWVIEDGILILAYERCNKGKTMITIRDDLKVDSCVNVFQDGWLGSLENSDLKSILNRQNIAKLINATNCCPKCGVIREMLPQSI
ncbi:MAG: radical SAM protein [Candidatus Bilamarchaeaceae archaeon]